MGISLATADCGSSPTKSALNKDVVKSKPLGVSKGDQAYYTIVFSVVFAGADD